MLGARHGPQSTEKLLVTFLDIQSILLQFLNGEAAVNAGFYCTALQHLKETILMKQTLDPDFYSAGADHVCYWDRCLSCFGDYVEK